MMVKNKQITGGEFAPFILLYSLFQDQFFWTVETKIFY